MEMAEIIRDNDPKAVIAGLNMIELAGRLRQLDVKKKELEAQLDEVKQELDWTDRTLREQMVLDEVSKFTHDKVTFSLNTRTFASPREGMKEELIDWLKQNGCGDMVKETVNAGTLSSWAKELREANDGEIPEDLQELLNVYDRTTVGMRSGR